ncbi:ankyrin repeat-containing domain protein, partial [Coniella lustricola]
MASSTQQQRRDTVARPTDQKWEQLRDFIRIEYLVNNKGLDQVANSLKGHDLHVSSQQLGRQLKAWGFRKSLSGKTWKFVGEQMDKRDKEARKGSLVLISGIPRDPAWVKTQVQRNTPPVYRPTAAPPPGPDEERAISVTTPRPGSPVTTCRKSQWPSSLPWLQFNQSSMNTLLGGIQLLPYRQKPAPHLHLTDGESVHTESEGQTLVTMHEFARKEWTGRSPQQTIATYAHVMRQIIKRTMVIMIGSEEMASSLIASRSIDCIAARFDRILPESFEYENHHRAFDLMKGDYVHQQTQVLRLLVYLVSNNLIMQIGYFMLRRESGNFQDEEAFIGLFRLSGLAKSPMLDQLLQMSERFPTISAVMEALFKAAVRVGAADIVSSLLNTETRFTTNLYAPVASLAAWSMLKGKLFITPLNYALTIGAPDLVKVLISGGADVNHNHYGLAPLAIAANLDDPILALELVQLLLNYGARSSVTHDYGEVPTPIQLALFNGNLKAVKVLLSRQEDGTSVRIYGLRSYIPNGYTCLSYLLAEMDGIDEFGFAALAGCSMNIGDRAVKNSNITDIEGHIINMMDFLLTYRRDGIKSFRLAGAGAMIVAAARGHIRVLEFLRSRQPELRISTTNGKVCPLSAAFASGQVEVCRLLLSWDSSMTMKQFPRHSWPYCMPSPWYSAVLHDSVELGELLRGQRIDFDPNYDTIPHKQWQDLCKGFRILHPVGFDPWFNKHKTESPLFLAILLG